METRFEISSLIAASRNGDDNAKAELMGRFREYLRLLAHLHVRPLMKSKFDESDIVQETCMQAIEGFEQFRGSNEKEFASWLRQILANKGAWMARKYRADKRDVRLEQNLNKNLDQSSIDLAAMLPESISSPSVRVENRERTVLLADAIAKLRGEQRDVVIMHGMQGVSVADVAKSLGRSQASAWKLWARGLQVLRKNALELM